MMETFLSALLGTSWKTSLAGYIIAIAQVIYPLLQNGKVTWKEIGLAIIVAVVGRIVKDANKSGNDKP